MKQDDSFKVIITIVIVAVLVLAFSFNRNNSEKLQQKYDALDEKYTELEESYSSAVSKCEDPLSVLYCYFEKENDISFEEAHDAFTIIDQQISQFY